MQQPTEDALNLSSCIEHRTSYVCKERCRGLPKENLPSKKLTRPDQTIRPDDQTRPENQTKLVQNEGKSSDRQNQPDYN